MGKRGFVNFLLVLLCFLALSGASAGDARPGTPAAALEEDSQAGAALSGPPDGIEPEMIGDPEPPLADMPPGGLVPAGSRPRGTRWGLFAAILSAVLLGTGGILLTAASGSAISACSGFPIEGHGYGTGPDSIGNKREP